MDFGELLVTHREQIMQRWMATVRGTLHPAGMPRLELLDHLPSFLDEVADALQLSSSPDRSSAAAVHGVQRLALGFNLDSVVREYGALRDAIVETAVDERVDVTVADQQVLFECVITAIADAVSEYQRERDAERQRLANEHFAFIAHELRNPLASALGALALLQRTGKLVEGERPVQIMQRGLSRLHELIESTLQTAQIGAGLTVRRERTTLSALLEDAETSAHSSAEERNVVLVTTIEGDDAEVWIDLRLVRSALTNLVRNAVKFTHSGSRVEIRAKMLGDHMSIEIEDRCGGLPDGAVERAFAPFIQMGTDRSGFGLGLAIAKQAADAHGGSIRIQDLPGRGCIFVLELPASP